MAATTSELVRHGVGGLRREPGTLLLAAALAVVASSLTLGISPRDDGLCAIGFAWDICVGSVLWGSFCWMGLRVARKGAVEVPDVLHGFRSPTRWAWNVLVVLSSTVLIVLGLVALVVPGVYLGLRLAFAQLFVNEQGLGPVEAMTESWRITEGHVFDVFALAAVSALLLALGLLCLVVGVVPAAALTSVAWGGMFDDLRGAHAPLGACSA